MKLCEVCEAREAVRKGQEQRDTVTLTFGYFCEYCVAYPNYAVSKPNNFELVNLTEVSKETKA